MRKHKALFGLLIVSFLAIAGVVIASHPTFEILQTKGSIANQQRDLIIFATVLSCIIVIPVLAMTFYIAWKYREGNQKATYSPEWDGSKKLEAIWWGVPCLIISVLGVVAWQSSHDLDPYKPLAASVSTKKPITIQVVALQWKWLFIYPEQGIATVNYVQFPEDTPVNFDITADAPMNSFWIPELGGQVYAMTGMNTKLHLIADKAGEYNGSSANLSGEGFARMRFTAKASSDKEFTQWLATVRGSSFDLTQSAYDQLAKPGDTIRTHYYASANKAIYDTVLMKYMSPPSNAKGDDDMSNMEMQGMTH
jgi:cytochrome o ubiquinol oxidase subunit 2